MCINLWVSCFSVKDFFSGLRTDAPICSQSPLTSGAMGNRQMAMRRLAQLSFTGKGLKKPSDKFGGSLLKGNPKTARPVDSKLPLHLVLRARESTMRLPKNFGQISRIIRAVAHKYGVRIYECANVGNHIHMVIRISDRKAWSAFIRELTGGIAQIARTLRPGRFWIYRPFTRIIRSWKKAFRSARDYVYLNQLEAEGHIRRSQIRTFKQLTAIFSDTA
jgi:REP element-mobilizing transposase RayT